MFATQFATLSHKSINKKSKGPKKRVYSSLVAEVVNCSPSTVRQVLAGSRSRDTELGKTIVAANILLEQGMEKLILEVKTRTVPCE